MWQGVHHLTNYRTNFGAAEGRTEHEHLLCLLWGHSTRDSTTIPHCPQQCKPHNWRAWGEAHTVGHQPEEVSWSWWRPRTHAEGLCRSAGWNLHKVFKSLTRMPFVDYSSAFNTILPHKLVVKLGGPGASTPHLHVEKQLPLWSQTEGHHTSTALSLSTGSLQGCVLSPLL